jgi:acetyl-CoA carboxylase carboxyltransferase component
MCSKDLGNDYAIAWPTAQIAVMGAAGAANIIFAKEIKAAEDTAAKRKECIDRYEALLTIPIAPRNGVYRRGGRAERYPAALIEALEILCTKRELRPPKKHGNVPL